MNVLVISHTYISPINRDKWKVLVTRHPETTIKVIFPTLWPSGLFNHHVDESKLKEESTSRCSFEAIPAYFTGNEARYFYTTKKLLSLLKNFIPDIVHVEQGTSALSYAQAIACCKYLGLQTKFSFFTWINWKQKKSRLSDYFFWNHIRRWNKKHTTAAFAGNNDAKKILREEYFEKPIQVLPQLGVDLQTFYPAQQIHQSGIKQIGYVGRLVPEKGIHLLLDAYAQSAQAYPEWELVFVGRGPEQEKLSHNIKRLNLQKKVTIISTVPHHNVAALMRQFSILVLPSYDTPEWKEQFGHVLIEAMASGVPIIGSDAGEIPYVIGDAGLIFEQKNSASLASKIKALFESEDLRKQFASLALKRVQKLYSHEAIADTTNDFWGTLLSDKGTE